MNLVVSQPMFLPWIGLFEQVRLSDVFIHYDDVQLPQGRSFVSRVQVKGRNGIHWLTAPIDRTHKGVTIGESWYLSDRRWRERHVNMLEDYYRRSPCFKEMMGLAEKIYSYDTSSIAKFNANSIEMISEYLGLETKFGYASDVNVEGRGSQRLLNIAQKLKASVYITGHGALHYLDHDLFDRSGIAVRYMSYRNREWPQMYGEFSPYVSMLDPIANCGREAVELVCSSAIGWKDYLNGIR